MNGLQRYAGAAVIAALSLAFASCSGQSGSTIPAAGAASNLNPGAITKRAVTPDINTQQLAVSSCTPCLTYQNGPSSETFYTVGSHKPRRTVENGIAAPWVGLVFDAQRDLFVANCTTCLTGQPGVNNVVEIKPGQHTPSVTITNGITYPYDLAIDGAGTLYASNLGCYAPSCSGQVSEYPHGYTGGAPSAVIQATYPLGLAIDKEGNLYVANCVVCSTGTPGGDQILVYAPGQTTPSRTIATGVNEPVTLAVDSSDDLYVANCMNCGLGAAAYLSGSDSITEYGSGQSTPMKTIAFSNVDVPFSLAVDSSADLFVGNLAVNSVTEYPPGATTPSTTITNGVDEPASLAIDGRGVLYVSNPGNNTVTTYKRGYRHGPPTGMISIADPSSIAVSP